MAANRCPHCLDCGVRRAIRPGERDEVCSCVQVILPPRADPDEVARLLGLSRDRVRPRSDEPTGFECLSCGDEEHATADCPHVIQVPCPMQERDRRSQQTYSLELRTPHGTFTYSGLTRHDIDAGLELRRRGASQDRIRAHYDECQVAAAARRKVPEDAERMIVAGLVREATHRAIDGLMGTIHVGTPEARDIDLVLVDGRVVYATAINVSEGWADVYVTEGDRVVDRITRVHGKVEALRDDDWMRRCARSLSRP